jgi:voltage-gated potassium channel
LFLERRMTSLLRLRRDAWQIVSGHRLRRAAALNVMAATTFVELLQLMLSTSLVLLYILGTTPSLQQSQGFLSAYFAIEICACIFFSLEFALRLACCTEADPTSATWRVRLRWLRKPLTLLDLTVLSSLYAHALLFGADYSGAFAFQFLRMLRLLTVLRLERYLKGFALFRRMLRASAPEFITAMYCAIVCILLEAVIVFAFEAGNNPQFHSIMDAVRRLRIVCSDSR